MKSNLTYLIVMLSCLFIACSSDGDENCEKGPLQLPNAVGPIDGAEYQQSLLDCRLPRVQTFTAFNFEPTVITAEQGTTLFINPKSFGQNGAIIDGDVTISLLEMYEPGEIVACQLSTNGINLNGAIEPLFSESIFFLDITFNDEPVEILQPIRSFIPSSNLGRQQFLFASPTCPELLCTVLWEEEISTIPVVEEPIQGANGELIFGYQAVVGSVGWKNIGRYNENESPRSTVYNKAPNGYNKTNANVFIQYDTPSTAIGLFDEYDTDLEVYTESFAQLPTGQGADIIFVTVQDEQYVFATKEGTVEQDLLTTTLETTTTDEAGLINALNNL